MIDWLNNPLSEIEFEEECEWRFLDSLTEEEFEKRLEDLHDRK